LRRGLLAVLIAGCALPAAAHAASVDLAGTSLRVIAAPGEANALAITSAGGLFTVTDSGALTVSAGLGCTPAAANRVTCSTSGVNSISVDAGDGDDAVTLAGVTLPATLTDGPGDDVVTGGSGNDTFIGSPGNDTLNGGPGNDSFGDAGGTGADGISGGTGTDTADYSSRSVALAVRVDDVAGDGAAGEGDNLHADVETVNGGSAGDTLVGSAGPDTLRGNGGDDLLDGRGGADTLAGGSGNDTADYSSRTAAVTVTLDGNTGDGEAGENDNVGTEVDVVLGGAGNDTLTGGSGANELHGGGGTDHLDGAGGNDVLDGGAGADSLAGGTGTDAADYSSRSTPITADLNGTTGLGEEGENDTAAADVEGVYGGSADDSLTGDANANVLRGGAGDDVLDGRLGADDVSGGDGTDSVSYAGRTSGVTIRLDNSANDGAAGEADNVRSDVERLGGGSGDDKIYADDDANVITGNGGNDTVNGYGGDDTITTGGGADQVWGGAGNDVLALGDGTNKAYGEDGDDRLTSGAGNDSLDGGAGDDGLTAGDGSDKLYGGDGNDTLDAGTGDDAGDGGTGNDNVLAGDGNDNLSGGTGDDTLDGAAGNDTLNGNDGADVVSGGDGTDKVGGNNDNDIVTGGAGDDQLWGGSGDDVLGDAEGDNKLYGEDGLDKVSAGDGNDVLSGGNGADLLAAGAGDDTVNGDNDADRLQGGDGSDKLYGGSGDDVIDGGLGADVVDGADGQDTVDYGSRTAGVVVTNDDKADDGQPGEGDNVASSIDDAIGGSGADRITFATAWPHHLDGGDGDDLLRGGSEADTLVGGRGKDFLFGMGGKDAYDGGPGNDHLSSTDGVGEKLQCGTGQDVSVQDKGDTAVACEKRTIGKLTAAPAPAHSEPIGAAPVETPANAVPVAGPVKAPSGLVGVKRVSSRGKLATVPGMPWVRVDRRILPDIAWIRKHYPIRINAGFATSGHALHGEHPLGLAIDIVPGPGGSWDDIDRLAKWAEPRQNYPRAPFRWVGYNGDVNHGRGNHLHLSWMHAAAKPGTRAAWVVTMRFAHGASTGHSTTGATRGAGALVRYARSSNARLGGHPSFTSGVKAIGRCSGSAALEPAMKAAARAFGLKWRILAGLTETESGFGCNMGPSSAGAIGWTQFMPATWRSWGMDADGDGKADPYDSVDAEFSTARLLRASGAPGSYRRALYAYNHDWSYVRIVLARSKKY
jgi:Ca2+-binding RTX toxin-like protein